MLRRILTILLLAAITAGASTHIWYSNSEDATGLNAQQKLDRVPNTANCHAVWHSYGTEPDTVFSAFWSYYLPPSPWGSIPIPTGGWTGLETGYPSVKATTHSGVVLFTYLVGIPTLHIKPPGPGGSSVPKGIQAFLAAALLINGADSSRINVEFNQFWWLWCEPPVLDAAVVDTGADPIIGWVGFIEHNDDDTLSYVNCRIIASLFFADAATGGSPYLGVPGDCVQFDQVLKNTPPIGLVDEFTNLSMQMDADFGVHCAWARHDGDIGYGYIDPGYYAERTKAHMDTAYLSHLYYPDMRNPQISVYGDSAYIVYQEAGDVQHIKCTAHRIGVDPRFWTPARDLDTRGDFQRDQPYRRNKADIWQEQYEDSSDYEIYDLTYDYWVSPTGDRHAARYPNLNTQYVWGTGSLLGDPPQYPPWIYALWTEETGVPNTPYDVRFDVYRNPTALMSSGASGTTPPVYLGIIGGEEDQPYALRREGTWRLNDYALDYDPSELLYKVSFLAQPYQYLARVIVSVPQDARIPGATTGSTAYTEEVSFDNTKVGVLTFAPGMTDTLYALIPADAYAEDRMIRLSIKGLAGAPALLKEFKVYRFETEPAEAQGSSGVDETPLSAKIKLWATQTSDALIVYYSLSEPSRVAVKVFDCSGRCVSSNEVQGTTGVNSLSLDKQGMSAGVYFIRVSTPGESATCKTINLH